MGFVNSLCGTFETITFQSLTQSFINGELGPLTWNDIVTIDGKFYTGSSADSIVSERYRVDLAGVILLDPEDLTVAIPDSARAVIGTKIYSIIYVDDVAGQEKVIQIPVKRFG